MKSWRGQVSFISLATVAVALLVHGCQSPESFHMTADDASSGSGGDESGSGGNGVGTGGASNGSSGQGSGGITGTGGLSTGSGGHVTTGSGGVGGRVATGSGGAGPGGHGGTAGRGAGGKSGTGGAGGRVTASGGAGGHGGRAGTAGRTGFGVADTNCIGEIQSGGYAYGTAPGCSACNDNGKSLETECQAVIDCLAPQWPCSGNCLTQCYNMAGASGPVMSCVSALTTAACGT